MTQLSNATKERHNDLNTGKKLCRQAAVNYEKEAALLLSTGKGLQGLLEKGL